MAKWESILVAGTAAALLTGGCTQGPADKQLPDTLAGTCTVTGEVSPLMINLDVDAIAQAMGSSVQEVQSQAVMVEAHCEPGETAEQLTLEAKPTKYSIEDFSPNCLALLVPEVPQPGVRYQDLGLICIRPLTV